MNPIAAHEDELKKLLEDLSADSFASEITFVASLDAYYRAPRSNCSDIRAAPIRRQPNKRRINMKPTLAQNCALDYAQDNKTSQRRAALFKEFRAAALKQGPDVRRRLASGDLFVVSRPHQDNGR